MDESTKEPLPYATIKAIKGGVMKGGTVADFDGNYDISPLAPGAYEIEISSVGYVSKRLTGVTVHFETTNRLNILLKATTLTTNEVVVEASKEPLIQPDNTSGGKKFSAAELEKMPSRNLNALMTTVAGVGSADDGAGLNIRGNREGDNAVFVNGVRQFGTSSPPVEAIEDLAVITGGIPAQYGDALGGVISITTKSAAKKFYGSIQAESSRPFDNYNYDLLAGNLSGPLVKSSRKDSMTGERRTLVGFFGALQYNGYRDDSPSAYGYYVPTDATMSYLQANPVRNVLGRYVSNGNFLTRDNFRNISYQPGSSAYSLQFNGNIDFQPADNTLITLGGTYSGGYGQQGTNFNFFNYANSSAGFKDDYNVFLRFRQSFNNGRSAEQATLRNVYYQLQFDVSHSYAQYQDPNLKDNLSQYNYVGQFKQKKANSYIPGGFGVSINSLSRDSSKFIQQIALNHVGTTYVLHDQNAGLSFQANQYSNQSAGVNLAILRDNPNIFDNFSLSNLSGGSLYTGLGAAVNGGTGYPSGVSGYPIGYTYSGNNAQGSGGGQFDFQGTNYGFGYTATDQYRLSAQAGADIGRHTIKMGFEFEQRVIYAYQGATNLYVRGRSLLNRHLYTGSEGSIVTQQTRGRGDTVDIFTQYAVKRDPITNQIIGQTDFDRNLRASLGKKVDEFVNIDEITPDKININQFSVSDIFAGATNPMAGWQGYNAYGVQNKKATSFYDFFTDTLNRPVDAFRPIYVAGYIEDKLEINDLIFRIGVRVDRFDANTQVLKDQYSLTRLDYVGDANISKFSGTPVTPGGIGNNYAVYVNQSALLYDGNNQSDFKVVGYRNGSQWYDANGTATQSSEIEKLGGGTANPWFTHSFSASDVIGKSLYTNNKLTFDAFQDFKPQINVMPRMSFSFPISDQALFYAHYDILTQRPLTAGGGQNYASPMYYYALVQGGGSSLFGGGGYPYIPNANLMPQKKIDYEMGFQQALTTKSVVKISAFYQEIKDLIQIIQVQAAYPGAYQTDGNQDFGISKGAIFEYELRRTNGFTMNASYTLQFAEVSNSNLLGNLSSRIANSTLRDVFPASYDQRHAFKFNFDFHYKDNEGPVLFGKRIFANSGINLTNFLGSGTPYTRYDATFSNNTIAGDYNGERKPWNYRAGLRIDKSFIFQHAGKKKNTLNVYLYVQNLFNTQNVINVYRRTGSATDDGYLNSAYGRQQEASNTINQSQLTYELYYNLQLLNPDYVSIPRRTRLGLSYSF